MNWHARLAERRGEDISKRAGGLTDKTDKRGFVGFVSDLDGHSENIAACGDALHAIRARLLDVARTLGIPRAVVDGLPVEELDATAEQTALCEGYADGNGDPLAHALLVFYLRALADPAEPSPAKETP